MTDPRPSSAPSEGGSAFARYHRHRGLRYRDRPLAVAGYFGRGNAGDNAIHESLEGALSHRSVVLPVRRPGGGAVGRIRRWAGTLRAVRWSRGLIFGGGGLLKSEAGGSGFGVSLLEPALAIALGRPVFGVGLGVDPTPPGRPAADRLDRNVLKAFQRMTVRDRRSHEALAAAGVRSTVTADLVWAHPSARSRRPLPAAARSGVALVLSRHGLLLGPALNPAGYLEAVRGLELLGEDYGGLEHLAFCRNEEVDDFDVAIRDGATPSAQLTDLSRASFSDVLDAVAKHLVLVGMRYHSLVAGVLCHVPVIALGTEDKVVAIARTFGVPNLPIDGNLTGNIATELRSLAASGFAPNYDTSIAADLATEAEMDLLDLEGTLSREISPPNYHERVDSIRFLSHLIWTLGIARIR